MTWPARTAPRGIDIVLKRGMIPVVMSMETVIAVDCVPPMTASEQDPRRDVRDVGIAPATRSRAGHAQGRAEHIHEDQVEDHRDRGDEQRQRRVAPAHGEVAPQHRGRVGEQIGRSHSVAAFRESPLPVRDRKTSSRSGVSMLMSATSAAAPSSWSSTVRSAATPPSVGTWRTSPSGSRRADASRLAARSSASGSREFQAECAAGDQPLQLGGRALRHDAAVVEQRDLVRELIGLLQVLRGQEDGDPVGDQLAHDLPHRPPPARVDARWSARRGTRSGGCRSGSWPGPAAASCRRSRCGHARRPGRQLEAVEQVGDPAPALVAPEVVQGGHELEVLLAGQEVVDRRELAGDADLRRGCPPDRSAGRGRPRRPRRRPA